MSAIRDVSDTARWVAAYRAMESSRGDALFRDPFAARLAGDRGPTIARLAPRQTRDGWPVIARAKAIDDMGLAAIRGGCDCVISLAAGFDTRPYRLPLPSELRWIEADLPDMIAEKNAALADASPRCALRRAAVDLADPAARAAFLDDALKDAKRALVITEGLVMYLTPEVVASLAGDLARPTVECWLTDVLSPASRDLVMLAADGMLARAPMRFAPANGVAFFETLGWRVDEVRSLFDEAHRFGRLPPLLNLIAMLPLPRPNPRRLGRAAWAGVARLSRWRGSAA